MHYYARFMPDLYTRILHGCAFQSEFANMVGSSQAVALSSGTAALHLAIQLAGVGPGDEVLVSTLTFAASVNPIRYLDATPVFIDSERESWNMDPELLCNELARRARVGKPRGRHLDARLAADAHDHFEDAADVDREGGGAGPSLRPVRRHRADHGDV